MPDAVPVTLESQISSLRAELKEWERVFAAENGGRKAGRQDIKNNGDIAAKYKTYSRLRGLATSSSDAKPATEENKPAVIGRHGGHSTGVKKRKREGENDNENDENDKCAFTTPRKNYRHSSTANVGSGRVVTPQRLDRDRHHPSQLDPYDSPSRLRTLLTPSQNQNRHPSESPLPLRSVIGPTPQRDGKALGLFDLLSGSGRRSATAVTPSRRKRSLLDAETPSKQKGVTANNDDGGDGDGDENAVPFTPNVQRSGSGVLRKRRYSLTPASSGKKFYLSKFFATPTVSKFTTIPEEGEEEDGDEPRRNEGDLASTPNKGKAGLETPLFLRRRSLFSSRGTIRARDGNNKSTETGQGNNEFSPSAVRMPPRVVGKGLSALVQGLRDMEDEQMDDDLDALREMEGEQDPNSGRDKVLVEEGEHSPSKSQTRLKKVGQKRTTKLVTMRPNRARPKPQTNWEDIAEEDESEDELAATTDTPVAGDAPEPQVLRPRTRKNSTPNGRADESNDHDSGLSSDGDDKNYDDGDDDGDGDFAQEDSILNTISKSRKQRHDLMKTTLPTAKKSENPDVILDAEAKKNTKKPGKPRTVKPEAHANYRALKIRGKGGGGGGGRGRFGGKFRKRR